MKEEWIRNNFDFDLFLHLQHFWTNFVTEAGVCLSNEENKDYVQWQSPDLPP